MDCKIGRSQLHYCTDTNIVMSDAKACQGAMSQEETFSLIWDSGASMCITGDRRDFIGTVQPVNGTVSGVESLILVPNGNEYRVTK